MESCIIIIFIKARSLFDSPILEPILNVFEEENDDLTKNIIFLKANQPQTAINKHLNVLYSLKWPKRFHFVFANLIPYS